MAGYKVETASHVGHLRIKVDAEAESRIILEEWKQRIQGLIERDAAHRQMMLKDYAGDLKIERGRMLITELNT